MLHIAIEGNSGVGKTTLATSLLRRARQRGFTAEIALEHGFYMNPLAGDKLAQGSAELTAPAAPVSMWIALDERREALMTQALHRSVEVFISETSLISVLLYELAAEHLGARSQLLALIASARTWCLANPRILRPHRWIFLDTPPDTALLRLRRKGGSRDLYMQERPWEFLRNARLRIAREYLPTTHVQIFDNSVLPVDALSTQLVEELLTIRPMPEPSFTVSLLQLLSDLECGRLRDSLEQKISSA